MSLHLHLHPYSSVCHCAGEKLAATSDWPGFNIASVDCPSAVSQLQGICSHIYLQVEKMICMLHWYLTSKKITVQCPEAWTGSKRVCLWSPFDLIHSAVMTVKWQSSSQCTPCSTVPNNQHCGTLSDSQETRKSPVRLHEILFTPCLWPDNSWSFFPVLGFQITES